MKKTYLFVYNDVLGTREQVKEALNKSPLVLTWRYDIPHAFYLVSEAQAKEISEMLHETLGNGRFLVTELSDNYWGRGHKDTWYLIKNKQVRPKP
jgi:hypothetical protein